MKRVWTLLPLFTVALLGRSVAAAPRPVVLLVVAHPDDETCIGGSLGRLKELGVPVHALYVTRGEGGKLVTMTARGPRSRRIDGNKLGKIRTAELREAARRFGFKSHRVLGEPDVPLREGKEGKPTRDVDRFLKAKIWKVERIERAIETLARRIQPTIVLTMLPRHPKIHAHHQAVGGIVLSLFKAGRLGPWTQQVYAILEVDWYPKELKPKEQDVRWARDRRSKRLRMTYGEFFARASAAHQSQLPGHIAQIKPQALKTIELLRPLTGPRKRVGPLRRLLTHR